MKTIIVELLLSSLVANTGAINQLSIEIENTKCLHIYNIRPNKTERHKAECKKAKYIWPKVQNVEKK